MKNSNKLPNRLGKFKLNESTKPINESYPKADSVINSYVDELKHLNLINAVIKDAMKSSIDHLEVSDDDEESVIVFVFDNEAAQKKLYKHKATNVYDGADELDEEWIDYDLDEYFFVMVHLPKQLSYYGETS